MSKSRSPSKRRLSAFANGVKSMTVLFRSPEALEKATAAEERDRYIQARNNAPESALDMAQKLPYGRLGASFTSA